MKIALGEVYLNRTRMYLAPVVNTFGQGVVTMLNGTAIQAWGIYDMLYLKAKAQRELAYHLFVLQDPSGPFDKKANTHVNPEFYRKAYQLYLKQIRKTLHYVDDYPFTMDGSGHVTVFRLPATYMEAYDDFVRGDFSKMYDSYTLERVGIKQYLRTGRPNVVYQVLTRKDEYRNVFQDKINRMFGTVVTLKKDTELDSFSINPTYEVFNADFTGPNN